MTAAARILGLVQSTDLEVSSSMLLSDIPRWDSLSMVRLMVQIETSLGRELTDAELENLTSVDDVERLLANG